VNANPELVVASALKPSFARTRAEPASHGFGMTNGSPSWRARKTSPFARCDETAMSQSYIAVIAVIVATMVVLFNLVADVLYGVFDPRIRLS
jgi:hypothetical protein